MMKALFLTSIFYESPFKLGDHHLAEQFAQDGWQVGYVSAPITPFHVLAGSADITQARYANYNAGGSTYNVGTGKIWSYVPGALVSPKNKPILNNQIVYKNWMKLTVPPLSKLLSKMGFDTVDLLYFSYSIFAPMLKTIPHNQSVFRIADREAGYAHFTEQDRRHRAQLARDVDLVVYSAGSMDKEIEANHPKQSMHLSNGVDIAHFLDPIPKRPKEFETISNPIAIYVGAMRYWFDADLVNQMTASLPNVDFVLIGPDNEVRDRLDKRENLHLLGKKDYAAIPRYLHHADLGIIPFNRSEYPLLVNGINPLKLYEYAASGLPIVATRWDEIERINPPAMLCDDPEEFIAAIQKTLKEPVDREAQMAFARQFEWEAQFKKLRTALSQIKGSYS